MVFGGQELQCTRRHEKPTNCCLHVYYRLRLAGHHACWFASSALPRCGCIWSGTTSLETGKVVAFLAWSQPSPSANMISVREGVLWLLLATAAELPPAVRPADFLHSLSPIAILRRRCSSV